MSLVLKALAWLLGRLFGGAQPSPEAKAADRAAVAETQLATEKADDDAAQAAVAAVRRVDDQLVRQPDSLRAPDKYSRD